MRDYAKEYREYQGTSAQIKRRARRNMARRLMIRKYGKARLRGKDVDHKDGNPMNNYITAFLFYVSLALFLQLRWSPVSMKLFVVMKYYARVLL